MFIAHLPAGYLLSRNLPVLRGPSCSAWVMLGSVLPDVDLLWFYIVDSASVHHHTYLTHYPAHWLMLTLVGLWIRARLGSKWLAALGLGGSLHVCLDSVVGAIDWGWPVRSLPVTLVEVPATHDWWVLSFLTHWTIAIEGLICAVAGWCWYRQKVADTPTLRG